MLRMLNVFYTAFHWVMVLVLTIQFLQEYGKNQKSPAEIPTL
jgi:hypothetical protein